jgi:hypothetical protein
LLRRAADLVVLEALCERLRIGPLTRERARKLLQLEPVA